MADVRPPLIDRPVEPATAERIEEYNFEHFRTRHLATDGLNTLRSKGISPGEEAPDFELPRVDGGTLRLSELRGRPVLLHFGSRT